MASWIFSTVAESIGFAASAVPYRGRRRTTVADTLGEYKMANADSLLLAAGGKRGIERWFFEMGAPGGLVDFKALMESMKQHNYDGWVVVESDQSPHPEESVMLNGWYVKQVLSKVQLIPAGAGYGRLPLSFRLPERRSLAGLASAAMRVGVRRGPR
jgi:hypothetical protein